ncbi:hypothetical protein [Alcanivorax quisquiliarum]|uniref:Uncharacterized protein n=1 Tax=Alcanivorax quisquiliarum TaxID=2933565 RepID=A0ABT0E4J0_9GAMM|nr:hypothetical protein [Alcanivorax quisquiliarum]MCK0536740.1 hypothetical protein [Alcanivorax quisquiliarum]
MQSNTMALSSIVELVVISLGVFAGSLALSSILISVHKVKKGKVLIALHNIFYFFWIVLISIPMVVFMSRTPECESIHCLGLMVFSFIAILPSAFLFYKRGHFVNAKGCER